MVTIIASSASGLKNQKLAVVLKSLNGLTWHFWSKFWVAFGTFIEVSIIASSVSGKTSIKKNSKKSDIVTIRSGTYLPYLNSDIKFSDICSKTFYLPTQRKWWRNIPIINSLKALFCPKSSWNMYQIDQCLYNIHIMASFRNHYSRKPYIS